MKIIFMILLFVLLLPLAHSSLCTEEVEYGSSCEIMTPVLACSTNATILNLNGTTSTQEMDHIVGGIYNFSFSEEVGNYTIILCDNSTTQLSVKSETTESNIQKFIGGDIMLGIAGLLFIIIAFFIFLYYNVDRDKWYFKVLFISLCCTTLIAGTWGIRASSAQYGANAEVLGALDAIFKGEIYVFITIVSFFFLFYLIRSITDWNYKKKHLKY